MKAVRGATVKRSVDRILLGCATAAGWWVDAAKSAALSRIWLLLRFSLQGSLALRREVHMAHDMLSWPGR
jgi:hypothetical protein